MKGKFPTIVMAMMALVLALSLAVVGAGVQTDEAEAGDLTWSTLITPSIAIGIYPWMDIDDLALSPNYATDMTLYAAVNDPMNNLMGGWAFNATPQVIGVAKSNNGGIMWSACTQPLALGAPPVGPLMVAVAPDDANFVVATDGLTIWASADGGGTWAPYGTAAAIDPAAGANARIQDIAVGPFMTGTHPIAIGIDDITALTVDLNGVYLWGWGSPPSLSWAGQGLVEDVWAVAFSPTYGSDFTIVAAGSTGVPVNNVHLGDGSTQLWDLASPNYPLWPRAIDPGVAALASASIALPSDFNGLFGGMQVAFVGTTGGTVPDVYRVRNVGPLALGSGVTGVNSLDVVGTIGGSAALMVGDTAASATLPFANVAYTSDPWSAAPWWSGANKAPTGLGGMALVALHPDYLTNGEAFCGTGPSVSLWPIGTVDESALSKSTDSGLTWNQISLIDTDVTVGIADLAPSPDYGTDSTLFVATSAALSAAPPVNPGWDSLWKSTMGGTLWERVDVLMVAGNTSIIRISPDYGTDDTVYWAETGGNRMRMSTDGGGFFLTKTVGWAGVINDIAVEDGTTLYLASGATVGKSTDGASTWPMMGTAFAGVGLLALHAGTGDLYCSGTAIISYVDTSTMTVSIQGQITGEAAGSVQWIAFSNNYASDKTIYVAGTGATGMIWKLSGVGGALPGTTTQISLVPAPATSGLAVTDNGVLYCADPVAVAPWPIAAGVPTVAGSVLRTVNPDDEPVTFGTVPEFLRMTQGLQALPAAPTIAAGGAGAGHTSLWTAGDTVFVRDVANPLLGAPMFLLMDRILVYGDTMPLTPSLSSPADGATGVGVQVGQLTGVVMYYATVEWGAISGAYGYGLQIDTDTDFANPIVNIGVQAAAPWLPTNPLAYWTVAPINQPATSYTTPAGAAALLNPDTEYFWRARVDNTALGTGAAVGQWSSGRSFSTGPGIAPEALTLQSPKPGDTDVSVRPGFSWTAVAAANQYEFELSDEDGASVVTRTLDGLSYIYDLDDDLDEDATYSWSVRGINTTTGFESPWSSATFTTGVPSVTPIWVWIVIAIGAVVAIVVIVLIVRTRRPV